MWSTPVRCLPRLPSSYLDYAKHMPKKYVDRMKRTIPKKVYGGRFGAPDIVHWRIHPDDYEETGMRPWENDVLDKNLQKENNYNQKQLGKKFYDLKREKSRKLPDEKWHFFPGDKVQVMVGKDKGKQGTVLRVSRATSEVWVENMNCALEENNKGAVKYGLDSTLMWKEKPLSVLDGEVMLVDSNDEEPCTTQWVLDSDGTEYVRKSLRSGYEIPVPSQAKVTYEYVLPEKYMEVQGKDTLAKDVLKRTYVPRLATFAEEISEQHAIPSEPRPPTYWY